MRNLSEKPFPAPPELTTIVATYNGKRFLRQAILSLLAEQVDSMEILLADDGSSDGTLATVQDLPIRIMKGEKNGGTASAYNRALSEAKGEYIAFVDHDDIVAPGAMQLRLNYLRKRPNEMAVRGVIAGLIDSEGRLIANEKNLFDAEPKNLPNLLTKDFIDQRLKKRLPFLCAPWLCLFRKKLFDSLGPFDETLRIAHDVEYMLRILEAGPIAIRPIPTIYYRMHDTNCAGHLTGMQFRANRRTVAESALVAWSYGFYPFALKPAPPS